MNVPAEPASNAGQIATNPDGGPIGGVVSPLSPSSPSVAVSNRSALSILRGIVRNPLRALPPDVFARPLVYSRLFGRVRLYICDPVLVHEALVRHADHLSKGDIARRVLSPALGNGLLTAEGSDWRWQRQSVSPAFQHGRLLAFLPAMIEAAEATGARWMRRGDAEVDLGHEMMLTTYAVIVATMLSGAKGIDVRQVERSIGAYLDATNWSTVSALLGLPEWVPHPGQRTARAAAASMRDAVETMVAERRQMGANRKDLVSLLLQAADPDTGRVMTDREITDNLLTFITAGHETTAQGLAWTFALLAENPAVEATVLAEIGTVVGSGPVRPDHIAGLTYTRQVFSEAMRLYPPAPLIVRRVERAFDFAGFEVPVGTALIVPTFAIHRHAGLWDAPDRFDPDRFAPERAKGRHRYSYMPFGAGPRTCIGSAFALMEGVAILAVLLRAFHIEGKGAPLPEPTMKITLRPMRPLRMRVRPRTWPKTR